MIRFVDKINYEEVVELIGFVESCPENDRLSLKVRDVIGDEWYIAEITAEGKLRLCEGLPDYLGLSLDKRDRIEVIYE